MATVFLTKRIEFSASHRYHNDRWDAARNRSVFGACNNPSGHGHNYLLEVTVCGEVDAESGMVVNLYDLKVVLKQVLEAFDHKHLNLDTDFFKEIVPTTENIARVIWRLLASHREIGELRNVRLFEDEDLYADITGEPVGSGHDPTQAKLTRRYHFSAAHRVSTGPCSHRTGGSASVQTGDHGHNYTLEVCIEGRIDPETGMVTDIPALDRTVHGLIIGRWHHRHLNDDPELSGAPTGENLVRFIWPRLKDSIAAGRLERIRLIESPDTSYEYAADPNGRISCAVGDR
jgi:6-pyruvoyltetrahydropterin/6-carboxytetrahydropterin synthase